MVVWTGVDGGCTGIGRGEREVAVRAVGCGDGILLVF